MKFEYLVWHVSDLQIAENVDALQEQLNQLAQDDWRVICYCPQGLILCRETPESLSARIQQAIAFEQARASETWSVPQPVASDNVE